MKFIILHSVSTAATHHKNGEPVQVITLPEDAEVQGPISPITAGSLSALETAQELTPIQTSSIDPLQTAKWQKAREFYADGRAATLAIFSSLPVGVQAQFSPVLDAADRAAKAGNAALAKETVETCVVPEALAAAQSALVDQLTEVVGKFSALAAATTVEEVNAIS